MRELKTPRPEIPQTNTMSQDPFDLRSHYTKAATRRRRAKALRTLVYALTLVLAAGIAWVKMILAA